MILSIPNNFQNFQYKNGTHRFRSQIFPFNFSSVKSADSISFQGNIDSAIFIKLRKELLEVLKKTGIKHVDFKPMLEITSKDSSKLRLCGDDAGLSLGVKDLKNPDKYSVYFLQSSGKVVCAPVKSENYTLQSAEESLRLQKYINEVLTSKKTVNNF